MKLEIWNPLTSIERDLDSLFGLSRFLSDRGEFPFRPSMDVDSENGVLIVSTELPGMDPERDLEIILEDDFLTIQGEKTEEKEISEEGRHLRERRFGKFVRRVPVPSGVTTDDIVADYAKGILTVRVTVPEDEPMEPQKIPVSSKT